MNPVLVTVGTYWDPVEARLARIHLEAAGIGSILQNEHSVTMNWLEFANASKGVQLQVDPADADAALEVLERKSPESNEIGDEWEAGTFEELPGEEPITEEPSKLTAVTDCSGGEEANQPLNERELRVIRAYRTAILGLGFAPLQFYAMYLIGLVAISDEPIRPALHWSLGVAIMINVFVLSLLFMVASYFNLW